MSTSTESSLRRARGLIKQGRYAPARAILEQLDDPAARAWLEELENAKPKQKRQFDWWLPLVVVAAAVGVTILVLVAPAIIEQTQQASYDNALDPAFIDQSEQFYLDLMHYCTLTVGYGVESCMDWSDLVTLEHREVAETCLDQFDVRKDDEMAGFGECLQKQGVPPAF